MARAAVPLILASSSPRRQELLRQAGYCFQVRAGRVAEDAVDAGGPVAPYVESLAYLKAMAAVDAHGLDAGLVLGADTAVELQGAVIGKPADAADARRILGRLAGSTHHVVTGLALVDVAACRRHLAHETTAVRMKPMSDAEIAAYVASGEALGKAGAYALQETGDRYVEAIEGSYTYVVGLPMELLERMLKAAGHDPRDFRE
jgi:septum formation protein